MMRSAISGCFAASLRSEAMHSVRQVLPEKPLLTPMRSLPERLNLAPGVISFDPVTVAREMSVSANAPRPASPAAANPAPIFRAARRLIMD